MSDDINTAMASLIFTTVSGSKDIETKIDALLDSDPYATSFEVPRETLESLSLILGVNAELTKNLYLESQAMVDRIQKTLDKILAAKENQ